MRKSNNSDSIAICSQALTQQKEWKIETDGLVCTTADNTRSSWGNSRDAFQLSYQYSEAKVCVIAPISSQQYHFGKVISYSPIPFCLSCISISTFHVCHLLAPLHQQSGSVQRTTSERQTLHKLPVWLRPGLRVLIPVPISWQSWTRVTTFCVVAFCWAIEQWKQRLWWEQPVGLPLDDFIDKGHFGCPHHCLLPNPSR